MRVIRTEMYFDPRDVEWDREEHIHGNPGVAFAWLKDEDQAASELNIELLDDFQIVSRFDTTESSTDIDAFLAAAVQNPLRGFFAGGRVFTNNNVPIVRAILESPIVIENSPPEGIDFKKLLGRATGVTLGAYIGVQLAGPYPLLLIVTVPTGIIVVGSAIGISKALEGGLQKSVKRWFNKKPRKGR